jgi:hypothetical protein
VAVGSWTSRARSAAKYVARKNIDTVTVFLGAGASISSGAPSTGRVKQALFEADEEKFAGDIGEVSEKLHTISKEIVKHTIKPLFDDVHPHLGYLSLAALSRYVRVLIVNLNWDSAVEDACEQVGLDRGKYASLVLDDGVEKIEEDLKNTDYRLVNLHLHGRLKPEQSQIKFGRRETLSFGEREERLVWSEFLSHPTIVVGASLQGEYDVSRLLGEASAKAGDSKAPFWLFSRQAERTEEPEDRDVRKLLERHESESNFAGDPYVDFDRLMTELLEASSGPRGNLGRVFEGSDLAQPRQDSLVLPAPGLLKGHLDGPSSGSLLALLGERRVGKSTNARLVAHWATLRSERIGEVEFPSGRLDCARDATKLAEAGECSAEDFVIFEDPFGKDGEYEKNEAFVAALEQLLGMDGAPRVMITCCPSNWRQAKAEHDSLAEWAKEILEAPTCWYRGIDLAANADDPDSAYPAMVTRRVLEGVASTPARVAAAKDLRSASEDEEVIAEKLALLREIPDAEKQFLAVVRFYELSSSVAPQGELIKKCFQAADVENPAGDANHMLEHFKLDGDSFWRFAHCTDRAAFDLLYEDEGDSLLDDVLKYVYGEQIKDSVCAAWRAISRARAGDLDPVRELSVEAKREWGPLLLEEVASSSKAGDDALRELLDILSEVKEHDFWSLRELVYEVVRLWPELHSSSKAVKFLDKVLHDDKRMGRYCVIESLLYFQDTTHSETWQRDERLMELWEKATAARWAIVKDVGRYGAELALIVDALAWYRPPLPAEELTRWVKPLILAAEGASKLKGAFALTTLYHPAAEELFREAGRRSPLDYVESLDVRQVAEAAAMIRWHYVHQSRARALLPRRRLEPTNPDYLRRTEQTRDLPADRERHARALITKMASFQPHIGWSVHLGMNLYWTAGRFDCDFLGPCIDLAEDDDLGLITAAATYAIPSGALEATKRYFARDENCRALRRRLREGSDISHPKRKLEVKVSPPRFNAGRNPHGMHRELGTRWRGALEAHKENPSTDPDFASRVHAILRLAYEEGIIGLAAAVECERRVRAGDYEAFELLPQSPGNTDKKLQNWLSKNKEALNESKEFKELVVLTALELTFGP